MTSGHKKMVSLPNNRKKDKHDEDLLLFREIHKRDKDRAVSLLQPVSDEFEPNGHYPIYSVANSAGKRGPGFGFLAESEKNDYDWLKTPPMTPLFPSLEMEAKNAHELVVQRELPIIQPLSRFAGSSEEATKERSSNPKPRIPTRSITPTARSSSSALFPDPKKNVKTAPTFPNPKPNLLMSNSNSSRANDLTKKPNQASSVPNPIGERENRLNLLSINLSKNMQGTDSPAKTKPKSRGVSPLVRSIIPAQMPGFSDETPINLKTDRASSVSRGRSTYQPPNVAQKTEVSASNIRARRQSYSPSVTRGRKVAPREENNTLTTNVTTPTGSTSKMFQTGGNGGQVLGSKMVDKFLNARKTIVEDRDAKTKLNGSMNEGSGFERMISKGSLDMAMKHMDIKRESVQPRKAGAITGRKSTTTGNAPISKSNGGAYKAHSYE